MSFESFFEIKPRKNMTQKEFLRKTKNDDTLRFTDSDHDLVINGLDYFPFNKKKHGMYKPTQWGAEQNYKNSIRFFRKNQINDYLRIMEDQRQSDLTKRYNDDN